MFLLEEIIFRWKEYGNKQRIIETQLQKILENVRPIHEVENTTFNNNNINKDVNIKSSKDKSSKYQSSSKLINDNTIEKSALTKKNQHSTTCCQKEIQKKKRFFESKEKNEKRVPTETECLTIENVGKISLIRQWKKGTTRIVDDSMLAGIEQKHIRK